MLPLLMHGVAFAVFALCRAVGPVFGLDPLIPALFLSLCCIGSVFLLRGVFPLPVGPEFSTPGGEYSGEFRNAPASGQSGEAEAAKLEAERRLRAFSAAFELSRREEEVVNGVLNAQDNAAIAAFLGISERTVRHHLASAVRKTGASNRKGLELLYRSWLA